MVLPDVNVLEYAHREDTADHRRYRGWLEGVVNSPAAYGLSDLALSGFLRVVTHPRVFREPRTLETALAFVSEIRDRPNRVWVSPGPRHWDIFTPLQAEADARGNLVPDAYFAALAIESGCEWIPTDRDSAGFRACVGGSRWEAATRSAWPRTKRIVVGSELAWASRSATERPGWRAVVHPG